MAELWKLGAGELAAKIASGDVSSVEVVQAHLDRIDAVNPDLNAIVARDDAAALAAAAEADQQLADGQATGQFHGVPFTVKTNIDVAGQATTQGVPALADAIATADAPVVERMRSAGGIVLARTNMPDLGLRVTTDSSLYGLCRNPWNPDVTAGGSSGGEGSALAAGMTPFGLGNDIGGSLRNPATCCGITSIKPTLAVVPMANSIPPLDRGLSSQQMLCTGPMARHVADLRLGLEVLAGQHWRDPFSADAVFTVTNGSLSIAVAPSPPGGATNPDVAAVVSNAASILEGLGHQVVEVDPPNMEQVIEAWASLILGDVSVNRPLIDAVMGEDGRQLLDELATLVPAPSPERAVAVQQMRFMIGLTWSAMFDRHDVLLMPTWAQLPIAHGADLPTSADAPMGVTIHDVLRPVVPANLLGLPAVVVPGGVVDGLPVGVQVVGPRYADMTCLRVAEEIERAVGRFTPIEVHA